MKPSHRLFYRGCDDGNVNNNPPQPNDLSKILGNHNLTPAQLAKLETELDNLLNDCLQNHLFNQLDNGPNINFYIDANLSSYAAYNPSNNDLSFRNEGEINSQNLMEELFHAYQNNIAYPGGTSQYTTVGRANIEFEAEVYSDILELISNNDNGVAFAIVDDQGYREFIYYLGFQNSAFPNIYSTGLYDGYLNLWTSQNVNAYSGMTILNTLNPLAFNSLLNNPCN